jgi:hypothetical protein
MNQNDQFCCGSGDYQYCCNAQFVFIKISFKIFYAFFSNRESNQNQVGGSGDGGQQRYPKHPHYSRSTSRALAIVLPIAAILVIIGAVIIVFFYYKRLRNGQNKNVKSSVTTRIQDDYSGKCLKRSKY